MLFRPFPLPTLMSHFGIAIILSLVLTPDAHSFTRPTPGTSGELATTYAYDESGNQYEVTDNAGVITRTEYDALGRPTAVIENYDDGIAGGATSEADVDRVTRYSYNAAGQIVEQTADLPSGSADQVTHYIYNQEVAAGSIGTPVPSYGLLRAVVYPDALEDGETRTGVIAKLNSGGGGDFVETTYYADGAMRTRTDQRGVKLTYHYNDDGTRKAQVASNFDADTDDRVQSMTYTYDDLQRLLAVSSHSSAQAAPTATDVVNQVTHEYTGMGQLAKQRQDLDSAVDASGGIPTQDVVYAYNSSVSGNAFTKALRQTSVTYPNGRKLHMLYDVTPADGETYSNGWGAAAIDDALSRPNGLANDNGFGSAGDTLVAYAHSGGGTTVVKDLPRILTRLDHAYEIPSEPAAGDYLPGVDRFGRIERLRWDRIDPADGEALTDTEGGPLFDLRHAYDAASNRLHTERRIYKAYDELYDHDDLHRLVSSYQGVLQDDLTTIDHEQVRQRQVWDLDALGNQLQITNRDTLTSTGTSKHTPNDANELDQVRALGSVSRDQRSDTFGSNSADRWESIGTDTFSISGGWMTFNTVAADTIDGNTEDEARSVLLWGEDGPPVRAQYRFQFPSGATTGKAGFVFGYQSANDYWLQVWDLGTQELYWQQVTNGTAGPKLAAKSWTINAGTNYTSYAIASVPLFGHPFSSYDASTSTSATGRIGFFSTVANAKFDYLNTYLPDWSSPIGSRWESYANGSISTNDDALAFSGLPHNGSPFLTEGLRLDSFQATFKLNRATSSNSGVYVRLDHRDDSTSTIRIDHTSQVSKKVSANQDGVSPATTVNNNLPSCAWTDTLWVRVEAHAYGPSAGTVRIYANNTTSEPSGGAWNLIYESTSWDLEGGRFGFARHPHGFGRLDDLTIEADRDHDGTFEVIEHEDDFTLDTNGFVEQSPEHDAAGNLTYDGTFAYAYDAWNRLTTVTKAYRQPDGTPGSGAIQLGSVVNAVEYDGLGRRIVKRVQNSADFDTTEHHYYSGNQLIEIRNGSDLVVKQHVWGLDYIDELIEVAINQDPTDTNEDVCERPFYAVHNAQYNIIGLVQPTMDTMLQITSQRLVERYEYTPYGERQVYSHGWILEDVTGDGVVDGNDESYVDEFSYVGAASPGDVDGNGSVTFADLTQVINAAGDAVPANDPLVLIPSAGTHRSTHTYGGGSGIPLNTFGHQSLNHNETTGLIYNRARHLHPTLGRFMQRDPLGYVDGMSTYTYYAGMHELVDPWGLQSGERGGIGKLNTERRANGYGTGILWGEAYGTRRFSKSSYDTESGHVIVTYVVTQLSQETYYETIDIYGGRKRSVVKKRDAWLPYYVIAFAYCPDSDPDREARIDKLGTQINEQMVRAYNLHDISANNRVAVVQTALHTVPGGTFADYVSQGEFKKAAQSAVVDAGLTLAGAKLIQVAGAARGTQGVLRGRFTQTTASAKFSEAGTFNGRRVADVADDLASGKLKPADVPVEYVMRDGNKLIVNTRSSLALKRAGIPEDKWKWVDETGNPNIEDRITERLEYNDLDSTGTDVLRITGKGGDASNLE